MFYAKILIVLTVALCGSAAKISQDTNLNPDHICTLLPNASRILVPNTCNEWKICPSIEDADGEEGSCVYGLYFDKEERRCIDKNSVVCPFAKGDTKVNRCTAENDGTFLSDLETCEGYIYCNGGRETRASCPGELVFNPNTGSCVYKEKYTCTISDKAPTEPICSVLPNNFIFADEDDCTKFKICSNGIIKTVECDKDMAYDYQTGKCVEQDSVKCHPKAKEPEPDSLICGTKDKPFVGVKRDEDSCSSYYYCEQKEVGHDRQPKHVKCDAGKLFDAETLSCRDRLKVKCTLDRCEDMGNKYVNIAGDCTKYARCNNGRTADVGQCPQNYFFDERSQGCTPQNVSYIACRAD